jgi:hypothetical protein
MSMFRFLRGIGPVALVVFQLCGILRVRSTEFGGDADLPFSTNVIENVLVHQWKQTGSLRWIRASSDLLAHQGLNQVAIVRWAPKWSQSAGGQDLPDNLLALYSHCRTNYPVYTGIRQAWEIWNEPDFYFVRDNPDRMAAVLKAAYWGIKAGNSNALVLMPSMAFTPDKYQAELSRNNAFAYTDGYNFHFYGWAQDFLSSVRQHQRFLEKQELGLPLWVTEAGYFDMLRKDSNDAAELARQQAFHERLAVTAQAEGIDVYLPFILTPYQEAGSDLSLVRDDLEPRPALSSYLALSRWLPEAKPVYRIWHSPSQREIGYVLADPKGTWRIVLWTPRRWKDVVLPSFPPKPDALGVEDAGTGLRLHLQFAPGNQMAELGLLDLRKVSPAGSLDVSVSATNNVFLRTSPVLFAIEHCELQEIARTEGRSLGRTAARSQPSPVVVQMSYQDARLDKPSQTYRYKPGTAVRAVVSIYNFSEVDQWGEWTLDLPKDWLASVQFETGSASPAKVRLLPAGSSPALAGQFALAPLSRTDLPILLDPPKRAERALANRRSRVESFWRGRNSDCCSTVLAAEERFHAPNLPFNSERWLPSPQTPHQWEITRLENGQVHLVLQERPLPGRFASIFYVLPDELRLGPNDVLCAELRVASDRHVSYRLNLLTARKDAFRYTEDEDVGAKWEQINCRIGDFGAAMWSNVGESYALPVADLRLVRISFEDLEPGDFVEVRNGGVYRAE